jgi:hypothetical protein
MNIKSGDVMVADLDKEQQKITFSIRKQPEEQEISNV